MHKYYTIFLLFIFPYMVDAQEKPRCFTQEFITQQINEYPKLQKEIDAINRMAESWIANNPNSKSAVIQIPVVVHVLYRTLEQNISDEQIKSQIRVLNKDFNRLNEDRFNTPTVFEGIAANCEIQFCLALQDPDGNPTNGITRTPTTIKDIGSQGAGTYYSTTNGGHDIWDRNSYLNIWVCETGTDVLGFAATPSLSTLKEKDGVVIGYEYFGTSGTAKSPNNKGRTTTHEVGHWLGLIHLWGNGDPSGGNCSIDDGITDTPNQDAGNYYCPTFPSTSCSNGPNGDMFMNYMDYTDDECMNLFTEGQKTRMIAILNSNPRISLLSSAAGCSFTGINKNELESSELKLFPNPTNSNFAISIPFPEKGGVDVTIFSLNGNEVVFNQKYPALSVININEALAIGIYAIKIEQNGNGVTRKLIVTH